MSKSKSLVVGSIYKNEYIYQNFLLRKLYQQKILIERNKYH